MGRFKAGWGVGLVLILIALVALAALAVAVWLVPVQLVQWDRHQFSPDSRDPLSDADARSVDSARQAVLFAAGGVIAIVTIVLTAFRDRTARRAADVDRDANFTRRYTDAIAQLADRKGGVTIHVGGIFALDRIARESVLDRQPIVDVLLHFVREHAPAMGKPESLTADVAAALQVVGRITQLTETPVSLSLANLGGHNLSGVNLRGARLDGVNLACSSLKNADLTGASMRGANLDHVDFSGATLNNADLSKARAQSTVFAWASLDKTKLTDADLEEATFVSPEVYSNPGDFFRDAGSAHLQGADLGNANLTFARMRGAMLANAILTNIQPREADFTSANLIGADVSGTNFVLANIDTDTARAQVRSSDGTIWTYDEEPTAVRNTSQRPRWSRRRREP